MKNPPPFKILIIGLTTKRDELYRKIDARVDEMVRRGLVEEVKMLREKGYGFDLPSMSSVGYREIGLYIQGEIDLPTAVQRIKYETHRLARHQYAWFKLSDSRIYWFEV
jgi:tRNA dimethylallyltransferase